MLIPRFFRASESERGGGGEGRVGSLQHHQPCTEELLRVKARRAAALMGVSAAAPTQRRQEDRLFEAGWASKTLTEREGRGGATRLQLLEVTRRNRRDHAGFPLLRLEVETHMNESFSRGRTESMFPLCV